MSAHRALRDFFRAFEANGPGVLNDPGDAGSIEPTMWGQQCLITTATAETRTLARPAKAGILCSISLDTDGGDLTLTVTGGYNTDADTSITFDDAGDLVVFLSVKTGTTYQWTAIAQEGTDVTVEVGDFDALTATTATIATVAHAATDLNEHGAGAIGTGVAPNTTRYTRDGVIITDIKVDITGLGCKGDAQGDAIGAAYIGQYVVATNGIIFRIEMICLETPAGSATSTLDIDLMAEDDNDVAYDGPVDDTVIAKGASWAAGQVTIDNVPELTANDYFYLGEGDTAATTGVYTAGMFIIRLYGHPVLA